LEEQLPWLCQGDIFRDIPVLIPRILADAMVVAVAVELGPAILVTHNCAMDKQTRSGQPRVERLNFLPLLSLDATDPNRRALLRRRSLEPYEALYVGPVAEFGETYCVLSEMYPLPARYFRPSIRSFEGHPSAGSDEQQYLVPTVNDTRIGRIDDSVLRLLHDKLNAHWTRRVPAESGD
jgi:hypothetical protein